MANGDISIEQARKLLVGKPTDEQLAFIYQAIINQNQTCRKRPTEVCDKRYVEKSWLRGKIMFFSGVGSALTFIGGVTVMKILGLFG
jgi:hypothetical protein